MPSVCEHRTKRINMKFGMLLLNRSSITMRPRELTSITDAFEVEVFDVWPAADSDEYHIGLELIESRL